MSLDEVLSQLERLGSEPEIDSSEGAEGKGEERSKFSSPESILGAGGASQPPPPPLPSLPLSNPLA
jgi:hypothetical protein